MKEKRNPKVGVLFYTKKNRARGGMTLIMCRVQICMQRYEFSVNPKIRLAAWCQEAQKSIGKTDADRTLNQAIETTRLHIADCVSQMMKAGIEINILNFRLQYESQGNDYDSLLKLFEYHRIIERNHLTEGSFRGYAVTENHVKKFLRIRYRCADIRLEKVDKAFVYDFYAYLQGYRREDGIECDVNGALKHIVRLRRLFNIAVQQDWLTKNPCDQFHERAHKVERGFLTQEELDRLQAIELPAHLHIVRQCFIFAAYTGISYADLAKLSRDNIYIGIDGEKWMHFFRQKTKVKSAVPLLSPAKAVYEEFERFAPAGHSKPVFPLPTNQATNRSLKAIAKLAHIDKDITFHMARHTFATTITLSNNVPLETVSRMLGHASISTTQIYAKIVDNKISHDMASLISAYKAPEERQLKKINNK